MSSWCCLTVGGTNVETKRIQEPPLLRSCKWFSPIVDEEGELLYDVFLRSLTEERQREPEMVHG